MKKPGFWRLLGAYGVDFVILQIVNCIIAFVSFASIDSGPKVYFDINGFPHEEGPITPLCPWLNTVFQQIPPELFILVLSFIVVYGYFVIMESVGGKTLGKKLFHLKILCNNTQKVSLFSLISSYFVDLILLYPIACITMWILALFSFSISISSYLHKVIFLSILLFVWVLLPALYFSICKARWGKTLGKKRTGLQVVQEEKGE